MTNLKTVQKETTVTIFNPKNEIYDSIIINSIDLKEYEEYEKAEISETEKEKIQAVYEIFRKEFVHKNNAHIPIRKVFCEWLQGLPSVVDMPFYNDDIIKRAKAEGMDFSGTESITEWLENRFLKTYFIQLSYAFFRAMEKHKIAQ